MEFLPLRKVELPAATEREYDRWVGRIDDRLSDPATDRSTFVRDTLSQLYYPGLHGVLEEAYQEAGDDGPADLMTSPVLADLPPGVRIGLLQMDPRNVTLEPEYYQETDLERYARVKPVQWLWEMFDKSPLGENVALGVRLRRVLAKHAFRSVGRNFKAFHFVKFSFGYNMEVGDGVVVHRHVLLDDRGGIRIGDGASIADYANVYSHTHSLADGRFVDNPQTIIGKGVRITYHATVLAGVHLKDDAMLGSMAVATRDIESGDVALGIPAQPKLRKPAPENRPDAPKTTDPLADS